MISKCRWMWFYAPGWNIPPISNLYPVDDQSKSIPLISVKLNGTISNSSANLSYVQTFKNDSDSSIECIYKFPSDYFFAVVGLTVKVGDKTIWDEVMKRSKLKRNSMMLWLLDKLLLNSTTMRNYLTSSNSILVSFSLVIQLRSEWRWCENLKWLNMDSSHYVIFIFLPRYGAEEGLKGERGSYLPAEFGLILIFSHLQP